MSITRRALLRFAGMLSAAAAVPVRLITSVDTVFAASLVQTSIPAPRREALQALTAAEADILDAIVARLIPTDANGPGATEARAAQYIDRALAGALAPSRQAYAAGLAALDEYARTSKGASFKELSAENQEAVLTEVEKGAATATAAGASTAFFNMVRGHTIQGTFCDPHYGGNTSFVGWDLLGYPGVRTSVSPDQQRMGVALAPNHKSAYDYPMFTKVSASLFSRPKGLPHGEWRDSLEKRWGRSASARRARYGEISPKRSEGGPSGLPSADLRVRRPRGGDGGD